MRSNFPDFVDTQDSLSFTQRLDPRTTDRVDQILLVGAQRPKTSNIAVGKSYDISRIPIFAEFRIY